MKKYIKLLASILFLISFSSFSFSKSTGVTTTQYTKSDTTELKALIVKLLKWHETNENSDFEPLLKNPKDTVYTAIDWNAHKKRMAELEKTNLFAKAFLANYQQIALHLDKELKTNKTKYLVGDMPPYGNDANDWCNCQDYPGNIWKRLRLVSLKINENTATFKWTWGSNFYYSVKAQKENNIWKIAELERFQLKNFTW